MFIEIQGLMCYNIKKRKYENFFAVVFVRVTMEKIKLIIAQNIAELRREREVTQAELAEFLNYTDKAVSKWERGESIPDIAVLKQIADFFGVTLDYLVEAEHSNTAEIKTVNNRVFENRAFITGIVVVLVLLIATLAFVVLDFAIGTTAVNWLTFIYAVPATMIVWLVFNSIWFNKRINFLIISILMWSILSAIYLTALALHQNIWLIFILGVPGQVIILLWSRIRSKRMLRKPD